MIKTESTYLTGQPSVAPARDRGRAVALALVAGFVAAALIAVGLGAAGWLPAQQSSSSSGRSSAPLTLPARIGKYVRFADISSASSAVGKKKVAAEQAQDQRTAAALSAAHHGAGAAVQTYDDTQLGTGFTIWAVRDQTPAPVVTVVDPATLGYAVAPEDVEAFGDVRCDVRHDGIRPGGHATFRNTHTVICQRSASGLTVILQAPRTDIESHPDQAAAVVDQVWSQLVPLG